MVRSSRATVSVTPDDSCTLGNRAKGCKVGSIVVARREEPNLPSPPGDGRTGGTRACVAVWRPGLPRCARLHPRALHSRFGTSTHGLLSDTSTEATHSKPGQGLGESIGVDPSLLITCILRGWCPRHRRSDRARYQALQRPGETLETLLTRPEPLSYCRRHNQRVLDAPRQLGFRNEADILAPTR